MKRITKYNKWRSSNSQMCIVLVMVSNKYFYKKWVNSQLIEMITNLL
jgi:hypothetical protein